MKKVDFYHHNNINALAGGDLGINPELKLTEADYIGTVK